MLEKTRARYNDHILQETEFFTKVAWGQGGDLSEILPLVVGQGVEKIALEGVRQHSSSEKKRWIALATHVAFPLFLKLGVAYGVAKWQKRAISSSMQKLLIARSFLDATEILCNIDPKNTTFQQAKKIAKLCKRVLPYLFRPEGETSVAIAQATSFSFLVKHGITKAASRIFWTKRDGYVRGKETEMPTEEIPEGYTKEVREVETPCYRTSLDKEINLWRKISKKGEIKKVRLEYPHAVDIENGECSSLLPDLFDEAKEMIPNSWNPTELLEKAKEKSKEAKQTVLQNREGWVLFQQKGEKIKLIRAPHGAFFDRVVMQTICKVKGEEVKPLNGGVPDGFEYSNKVPSFEIDTHLKIFCHTAIAFFSSYVAYRGAKMLLKKKVWKPVPFKFEVGMILIGMVSRLAFASKSRWSFCEKYNQSTNWWDS